MLNKDWIGNGARGDSGPREANDYMTLDGNV